MAKHRLSTVHGELVALLTAEAAKATSPIYGLTIAREGFGFDEADAAVDAALAPGGKGLCIYTIEPFTTRAEDAGNQVARLVADLRVFLLENRTVNTGVGGANKNPLECVEAIWNAVARAPSRGPQIKLSSEPLETIDEGSGMRIYPIGFEVDLIFAPS